MQPFQGVKAPDGRKIDRTFAIEARIY